MTQPGIPVCKTAIKTPSHKRPAAAPAYSSTQSNARFIDPPFAVAPERIMHRLELPCPPSINALWRNNRGRTHKSDKYEKWLNAADEAIMCAGGLRGRKTIPGEFWAAIYIKRGSTRADLDNIGTKALFDWAQSRGYIANDKHCIGYSVNLTDDQMANDCVLLLSSVGF